MEILSLAGIFVGLALLMLLAYRGHSIVWIAPFCALIVALFALGAGLGEGRTLLTAYTVDYMTGAGNYFITWFPAFFLGAIYGKIMDVTGSARSLADAIVRCIGNGVPVIQGDLNDDLNYLPDASFDLVVLSHTLQETRRPDLLLRQIVRIGGKAAVSVINFGHWRCRMQVAHQGKMPRSSHMPFQWYDTPNIHFCTLRDFRELCAALNIRIVAEYPIASRFPYLTRHFPNLFAVGCVFVLEAAR